MLGRGVENKSGELPNSVFGSGRTGLSVVVEVAGPPGSSLNVRETIKKKKSPFQHKLVLCGRTKVNSQREAKHCSAPEAAAISSYSSRWVKQTEQIPEQSVFSVCSKFKAA